MPRWDVVGGSDTGGVLVREGQSLNSAKAGERLSAGALVEELELIGERLHYKLVQGTGPKEGWVSIKVGQKVLLAAREEPSGNAQTPSSAAPVDNAGDVAGSTDFDYYAKGEPASFTVVSSMMVIRRDPSTKSPRVGVLKQGDVVEGDVRGDWLLLSTGLDAQALQSTGGKWALIDGTRVGLGILMERFIPEPEVRKEYGQALELRCPDVGQKGRLAAEVSTDDNRSFSVGCPGGSIMLVRNLKANSKVQLRFCLKERGRTVASSKWITAQTLDVPDWSEGDELDLDLMGRPRMGCKQCSCNAYSCDKRGVGVNMDLTNQRCARCGCNVDAHKLEDEVVEPGPAAPEVAPEPVSEPAAPKEPLLIQKAIALPKELLLSRWRPLDCADGQGGWPRLDGSFKEVVAWSDLHVDMGQNMNHLRQLGAKPETVLVFAGDLATNFDIIEQGLRLLREKFGAVFYVPGNHELWVYKTAGLSSVHKFLAILELCEQLGVHTRPAFISDDCAVCPLFSWYKDNLHDRFTRDKANIPFDVQTHWPWDITGRGDTNDAQQPEIADFFLGLNERRIETAPLGALEASGAATSGEAAKGEKGGNGARPPFVITMSHFVPRQECYPGPRRLCGVMGCREIEAQLRACGARCHVFGHSHITVDREVERVRYVQHPLGYPTDHHRRTWPMRIWIGGASSSSAPATAEDMEKIEVMLGGEGKWFVWNSIWHSANARYADGLEGRQGHAQSLAQKREKATEDARRVREHTEAMTLSGVISEDFLRQLRLQAEAAGREVGDVALKGKPYKDVPAAEAPSELDAGTWSNIVRGVHLAAGAVCELMLDEYFLRKTDVKFEINHGIWMKCVHYRKGQKIQEAFEEHWHKRVAADPSKKDTAVSEVPMATLAGGISEGILAEIKESTAPQLERPPGRWSEGEVWEKGTNTFDRESEMLLRAEMDGKTLAEMWSAPPANREIELSITCTENNDEVIEVKIMNTLSIRDLKDQIVQQIGRGAARDVVLKTFENSELFDDEILSSVEDEIVGGMSLSGIDLSPPKEVDVLIVHAASDTPQSLIVSVMDTSSILDLRKAIKLELGERGLSSCKLVRRLGQSFTSLDDKESLGGRTEFLFLGRDLPAGMKSIAKDKPAPSDMPVSPASRELADPEEWTVVIYIDRSMDLKSTMTLQRGTTVLHLKQKIANDDPTGMTQPDQFSLRSPTAGILPDASVIRGGVTELELCM